MRPLFVSLLFSLSLFPLLAQEITVLDLTTKSNIDISGNLADGTMLPLDWAASSQMACFPATRFNEFQGNHLFYRITMPANASMEITVAPKNGKDRINLYALRLGANNNGLPPSLPRAISCEASYPIYAGTPNYRIPAQPQSVDFISIRHPYTIVIGIAGAVGVLSGEFDLNIKIDRRKL